MLIKSFLVSAYLLGSTVMYVNWSESIAPAINSGEVAIENVVPAQSMLVRAVEYDHQIIPTVELNTIEVRAFRDNKNIVKAKRIGNRYMPTIELEEIIVRPI